MSKRKSSLGLALENPPSVAKKKVKVVQENSAPSPVTPIPSLDAELATIDPSAQIAIRHWMTHSLTCVGFGGDLPISKKIGSSKGKDGSAVVSLTWDVGEEDEPEEKELLATFSDHIVKTYNPKLRCFSRLIELQVEQNDSKLIGLCSRDSGNYVFGQEDGTLAMWKLRNSEITVKFKTGDNMSKVKQCPQDRNFYATGSNESDLKVWNIGSEKPEQPVFKARNVPHDELDLRNPVWVQDLTFLPRTTDILAVGTRYGQLRLYDVRADNKNRPVSNVQCFDHAIMSISATMNDRQVIVGTAKGEAGLYDLRNPKNEKFLRQYVGFSGSIRCVEACSDKPYFVSCGSDRHLYVHKLSEKTPVEKLYLRHKMNCIALSKTFMEKPLYFLSIKNIESEDDDNDTSEQSLKGRKPRRNTEDGKVYIQNKEKLQRDEEKVEKSSAVTPAKKEDKKSSKKRKNKKKKKNTTAINQAESGSSTSAKNPDSKKKHGMEALSYLQLWSANRHHWKFERRKQTWLLKNCLDVNLVDDKRFEMLVEYIGSVKGGTRKATLQKMESIVKKYDMSGGGGVSSNNDNREASDDADNSEKSKSNSDNTITSEMYERARQVMQMLID